MTSQLANRAKTKIHKQTHQKNKKQKTKPSICLTHSREFQTIVISILLEVKVVYIHYHILLEHFTLKIKSQVLPAHTWHPWLSSRNMMHVMSNTMKLSLQGTSVASAMAHRCPNSTPPMMLLITHQGWGGFLVYPVIYLLALTHTAILTDRIHRSRPK